MSYLNWEKNFNYNTLNLKDDYEGKVIATFIEHQLNIKETKPVFYIHGFIDYFFHPHVADYFIKNNYSFYALELRKYGNSILPHQHKNYCKNIEEYFEEIDICLERIYNTHQKKITLIGHSTGGLISTLYAQTGKNKHLLDTLVLNSPFFDFNFPKAFKWVSVKLSYLMSSVSEYANLKKAISPLYCKSLHKDYYGEWDFNIKFKPIYGLPAYFKWVKAIHKAHLKILKNQLDIPVLILHSNESSRPLVYSDKVKESDVVLNIKDIKRVGNNLGKNVTLQEIPKAIHDVFLSNKKSRIYALNKTIDWLKKQKRC